MSAKSLDVSVGARLWWQGSAWTVVEHESAIVILRSGEQFKKVHAPSLVGVAQALDDRPVQDADAELDAVVLASLTSVQRAEVEQQAKVFDELLLVPSDRPVDERYRAAAEELGISLRTAYRRGQRYAEKGLVGLVDSRRLQPRRPSVDPEWDSACLETLHGYRDLSNPTMKSVLRKTNERYLVEHPQSCHPVTSRRLPSDPRAGQGALHVRGGQAT